MLSEREHKGRAVSEWMLELVSGVITSRITQSDKQSDEFKKTVIADDPDDFVIYIDKGENKLVQIFHNPQDVIQREAMFYVKEKLRNEYLQIFAAKFSEEDLQEVAQYITNNEPLSSFERFFYQKFPGLVSRTNGSAHESLKLLRTILQRKIAVSKEIKSSAEQVAIDAHAFRLHASLQLREKNDMDVLPDAETSFHVFRLKILTALNIDSKSQDAYLYRTDLERRGTQYLFDMLESGSLQIGESSNESRAEAKAINDCESRLEEAFKKIEIPPQSFVPNKETSFDKFLHKMIDVGILSGVSSVADLDFKTLVAAKQLFYKLKNELYPEDMQRLRAFAEGLSKLFREDKALVSEEVNFNIFMLEILSTFNTHFPDESEFFNKDSYAYQGARKLYAYIMNRLFLRKEQSVSREPKSNNNPLMHTLGRLNYPLTSSDRKGVCFGLAWAAIQAILSDETYAFIQQLESCCKISLEDGDLKYSEEEKQRLLKYAYLNDLGSLPFIIMAYQQNQNDILKVQSLTMPKKLAEHGGIKCVRKCTLIYTVGETIEYLCGLENIWINFSGRHAIKLQNRGHTVTISFDVMKNKWLLIDINEPELYLYLSRKEMAAHLHECLVVNKDHQPTAWCGFTSEIFTTGDSDLENWFKCFNEFSFYSEPLEKVAKRFDSERDTGLMLAVRAKDFGSTEVYLHGKADPNCDISFSYTTPLWEAALLDNPLLVKFLLDHKGDPNTEGPFGKRLLQVVLEKKLFQVAAVLLENGADLGLIDTSELDEESQNFLLGTDGVRSCIEHKM